MCSCISVPPSGWSASSTVAVPRVKPTLPLPSICMVKRSGATLSCSVTFTANAAAVIGPMLTFIAPS